ncbi:MAG TPA: hypothetical protein VLD38_07855 [Nitrosopumilaceae archaeon]|nr:hypothetical protein [Nitrosopumilaceae archaeon]
MINSVEELLGSSKKGRQQIENILSILRQAESLFPNNKPQESGESSSTTKIETKKKSDLHRMNKQERILKIIERFTNEFETHSLPNEVSVKNYLLFLVVIVKLAKKLKAGYQRSLTFAHTLSRLNQMFVNHPLEYNRRVTRDPLGLLFLVSESALEANRNLKSPYQFEDSIFHQFIPLMTKYCTDSDDPLDEIVKTLSEMPKFRITATISEGHEKIIGQILRYCFPKMPLPIRIDTVTKLLGKIILEENDSLVLKHYNTLKSCIQNDGELKTEISKVARAEMDKTKHRRFVNGILDELAHPQI